MIRTAAGTPRKLAGLPAAIALGCLPALALMLGCAENITAGEIVLPPEAAPAPTPPAAPPATAPSAPVTEVLLVAPFALTHATYDWKQVAGTPVPLPPDPGASLLIPLPLPGVYGWEVVGGDGRMATPPVRVRLVVLADAVAARWAISYPDQLQVKPGDRFAIDLRHVTLESPGLPPALSPAPPAIPPAPGGAEPVTGLNLVRDFQVQWPSLAATGGPGAAPASLAAWASRADRYGPRYKEFAVPPNWPAGAYELRFLLVCGETTLHEGAIRVIVAQPPSAARELAATTQVFVQPVTAVLPAAQAGPGAPMVTLPYGDATLTLNLHDRLDLDGRLCSDPDGDKLTFHWWQTRSPAATGEGTTSFTLMEHPSLWRWQPTREADIGMHEFVLSVSDGQHMVYSPAVRVNVVAATAERSLAWRVTAGPAVVTEVGQEVQLVVNVERSDGDGWRASIQGVEPRWAQITRPPGILRVDPEQPLSRFQPFFRADIAGLYELAFSVAAGEKISNTETVRVQVVAANRPPAVLDVGPVVAATRAGTPVSVNVAAGDPDGNSVTVEWRPFSGPWARSDGPLVTEYSLQSSAVRVESVTTSTAIFQSAQPGMWWLQAVAFDGKRYSAKPTPVLIWVRDPAATEAPFGPYMVEGPAQGMAGAWLEFHVAGPQIAQRFVRWSCSDQRVRWQKGHEGAAVTIQFDPAQLPAGASPGTVVMSALVEDGLGQAVRADWPVTVRSAKQPQ